MKYLIAFIVIFSLGCQVVNRKPEQINPIGLKEAEKAGLPIFVFHADPSNPNSANGVDVYLGFKNLSDKEIKYVKFIITPYNRVNDILKCTIRNISQANLRYTGPLKPGGDNGTYCTRPFGEMTSDIVWHNEIVFKNVWYNPQIAEIKIESIILTFTDDSKHEISGSKLQKAVIPYRVKKANKAM